MSLTRRGRGARDVLLLLLFTAVFSLNYSVRNQAPPAIPVALMEAKETTIFTRVRGEHRESFGRTIFPVIVDSADLGTLRYRLNYRMVVRVPNLAAKPEIGDRWAFRGRIRIPEPLRNPGGFDWRGYYRRLGVRYSFECEKEGACYLGQVRPGVLRLIGCGSRLRRILLEILWTHIGGEEGRLMGALLLGERTRLAQRTSESFSDAGVMHILAVSGLHVGIIWFALMILLRASRMRRKPAALVSTLFLLGYCFLVGHRPPVVRATIVFTSFSFMMIMERELDGFNAVCVAAFVILVLNPCTLFDVGFQFSFVCAISIIRLFGSARTFLLGRNSLKRVGAFRWVASSFLVSLSAQVGSVPLVMYHFNRVALAPVLANLLMVPLASIDICLGLLVLFLGVLKLPLTSVVAALNWLTLKLTLLCVDLFASIPFSSFRTIRPHVMWMLTWYAFFLLLPGLKSSRRARFAMLLVFLLAVNWWLWDSAAIVPRPSLLVAFLDVGQGDSCLLRTQSGKTVLVDAGPAYGSHDSGEATIAPFLWSRRMTRIDALVLTHPHNDHLGGMFFLLDNFRIGEVLDAGVPTPSKSYLRFLKRLRDRGIKYRALRKGMSFSLDECRINVLHPDRTAAEMAWVLPNLNPNESSIVLQVVYGRVRLVLAGDIHDRVRSALRSIDRIDVLKAPHHGSVYPNAAILQSGLRPAVVVFSVGSGNRFGFPGEAVVMGFEGAGAQVYRTDRDGCIFLTTDGCGYSVRSMRDINAVSPLRRLLMGSGINF